MKYLRIAFVVTALALAVYAVGCKSSSKNPVIPPPAADVTINIVGDAGASSFSPNPDSVLVGQTVSWHNNDTLTHHIVADNASFDAGVVVAGATTTPKQMNTTGSFPYHCSIHPTMVGTLVVH